jgi:hypothetical protein
MDVAERKLLSKTNRKEREIITSMVMNQIQHRCGVES